MSFKDKIAAARTKATAMVGRHRGAIDKGVSKIGEAADTRTGGRHQDRIRKGVEQARAGLDKMDPDGPDSARPAQR